MIYQIIVIFNVWMCEVAHKNVSCHMSEWITSRYERVMSHVWIRHGAHEAAYTRHTNSNMKKEFHTRAWVCDVTHTNASCYTHVSCHTSEWVTSHIWTTHVTHVMMWMSHVIHIQNLFQLPVSSCAGRHRRLLYAWCGVGSG